MGKFGALIKENAKALIVAVAILAGVAMLAWATVNRNADSEQISVTGLGAKDFESDLIIWNGSFVEAGKSLKDCYERLYADQGRIRRFLESKGVTEAEFVLSSVTIGKDFEQVEDREGNRTQVFKGYRLQQGVRIESGDLAKVEKVAREITDLINAGIEFYSQEPQYHFTKLGDLKLELIDLAAANGRARAGRIAKESGFGLGRLKGADLGVFQIQARNSNDDYSWSGAFDTRSRYKTATITVRMRFGIR